MNEFDDPFSLYQQSRPSGQLTEDGKEIRLLGQPILAHERPSSQVDLKKYREHPSIRGQYFYTFPTALLEMLKEKVGIDRFDSDLLEMEQELSELCADSAAVGFRDGQPLRYMELQSKKLAPISKEILEKSGLDPNAVHLALRTYFERDVRPMEKFSMGYCGWLLTNQQFVDEHDVLLANHAETIRRWGTDHVSSFLPEEVRSKLISGQDPNGDPMWNEFIADFNPFLLRWRLQELKGPYLPVPIKPFMAGNFPVPAVQRLMEAGGVFYLPDTMPIPSRDQLRGLIDDALHRGEQEEHLKEWLDIIRANNMAKNRMDPFVRQFQLQHFWRILNQRHRSSMAGNLGKFAAAFASFYNVNPNKIKTDLRDIRNRLGDAWLERVSPI